MVGRHRHLDRDPVDPDRMRAGLEDRARVRRSFARRDLVAAAAAASVGGASAADVERLADRLAELAGASVPLPEAGRSGVRQGLRGPEPRWRSEDVLRAVTDGDWAETARAVPDRGAVLGGPAVERRPGRARERGVGQSLPDRRFPDRGR